MKEDVKFLFPQPPPISAPASPLSVTATAPSSSSCWWCSYSYSFFSFFVLLFFPPYTFL